MSNSYSRPLDDATSQRRRRPIRLSNSALRAICDAEHSLSVRHLGHRAGRVLAEWVQIWDLPPFLTQTNSTDGVRSDSDIRRRGRCRVRRADAQSPSV